MKTDEALAQWSDACAAVVLGSTVWINGNREPLSVALSHHTQAEIEVTELASPRSDWKAVVKVTPDGKSDAHFYLCVE
jgi:hypothetical protein